MLYIIVLADHVSMSSNANVDSIVIQDLPVAELVVELVGCGVTRVPASIFLVTVVIIENWGLSNWHSDDRAAMLMSASGAPVAVTALLTEQNGRNVVDLMGGLSTGTLLRDPATFAPSMTGIQDKREEENQEQEGNEASLDASKKGKKKTLNVRK